MDEASKTVTGEIALLDAQGNEVRYQGYKRRGATFAVDGERFVLAEDCDFPLCEGGLGVWVAGTSVSIDGHTFSGPLTQWVHVVSEPPIAPLFRAGSITLKRSG